MNYVCLQVCFQEIDIENDWMVKSVSFHSEVKAKHEFVVHCGGFTLLLNYHQYTLERTFS